jgi:four helix bundle protein
MAKGDDIQERMVALAANVVVFCRDLPKVPAGSHLANQLLRSGTSPAPNYAEARGAESDRDFVHKLREESSALARIITASIRTMKQRGLTAG